jgi:hypothetical protein
VGVGLSLRDGHATAHAEGFADHLQAGRGLFSFEELAFWYCEYTGKAFVCQGNLRTRSWVCLGAFSGGIRGIFRVEVARGCFQRFGEARQAFLRLIGAHRFLPRPVFLIFTTEGKRPRGSRGHDRGDNYQEKSLPLSSSSFTFICLLLIWFQGY